MHLQLSHKDTVADNMPVVPSSWRPQLTGFFANVRAAVPYTEHVRKRPLRVSHRVSTGFTSVSLVSSTRMSVALQVFLAHDVPAAVLFTAPVGRRTGTGFTLGFLPGFPAGFKTVQ